MGAIGQLRDFDVSFVPDVVLLVPRLNNLMNMYIIISLDGISSDVGVKGFSNLPLSVQQPLVTNMKCLPLFLVMSHRLTQWQGRVTVMPLQPTMKGR